MAEHEQQGAGAKRGSSRRRSAPSAAAKSEHEDDAPVVADAASTEHVEEAQEQAAAASTDESTDESTVEPETGGPVVPPPPTGHAEPDASPDTSENEPYPKDVLLARAERLLGVEPSIARGVLAEADDTITIAEAKARISAFLSETVTTGPDDDQEANR